MPITFDIQSMCTISFVEPIEVTSLAKSVSEVPLIAIPYIKHVRCPEAKNIEANSF